MGCQDYYFWLWTGFCSNGQTSYWPGKASDGHVKPKTASTPLLTEITTNNQPTVAMEIRGNLYQAVMDTGLADSLILHRDVFWCRGKNSKTVEFVSAYSFAYTCTARVNSPRIGDEKLPLTSFLQSPSAKEDELQPGKFIGFIGIGIPYEIIRYEENTVIRMQNSLTTDRNTIILQAERLQFSVKEIMLDQSALSRNLSAYIDSGAQKSILSVNLLRILADKLQLQVIGNRLFGPCKSAGKLSFLVPQLFQGTEMEMTIDLDEEKEEQNGQCLYMQGHTFQDDLIIVGTSTNFVFDNRDGQRALSILDSSERNVAIGQSNDKTEFKATSGWTVNMSTLADSSTSTNIASQNTSTSGPTGFTFSRSFAWTG